MADRLREKYFGHQEHPYRTFEKSVSKLVTPERTLLDVGCGRTAPVLAKFAGRAKRLVGIDLVQFTSDGSGMELRNGDITATGLPPSSVDVVMARSVMEHVTEPQRAYREMYRVLAPGGSFVFLTANLWDYASIVAMVVPNRWHPWVVERVEGRAPDDVFPIAYKCNTKSVIRRLAADSGFRVKTLDYLGQYPAYFLFNGPLFFLATGYQKLIENVSVLNGLQGWIMAVLEKPAAPTA